MALGYMVECIIHSTYIDMSIADARILQPFALTTIHEPFVLKPSMAWPRLGGGREG
jgi:hypothetical protein